MMLRARRRRSRTVGEVEDPEPYPDRLLDELPADCEDPAAEVGRRESVTLVFVAALQLFPAFDLPDTLP